MVFRFNSQVLLQNSVPSVILPSKKAIQIHGGPQKPWKKQTLINRDTREMMGF